LQSTSLIVFIIIVEIAFIRLCMALHTVAPSADRSRPYAYGLCEALLSMLALKPGRIANAQ
jgi:hypothetical protein